MVAVTQKPGGELGFSLCDNPIDHEPSGFAARYVAF